MIAIESRTFKGAAVTAQPYVAERYDTAQTQDLLSGVMPGHKPEWLGCADTIHRGTPRVNSAFFDVVHLCYASHHPLALRPDVLGYLVNYAVATEVKLNPEVYRDYFTSKAGKDLIRIRDDSLVLDSNSDWSQAIAGFEPELRSRIPSDLMLHMLPHYSVDTPTARLASLVSFMDAASPYYDYRVRTMCGIPEVRILGTVQDWEMLRDSAAALAAKFPTLARYFEGVAGVLQTIVWELRGYHMTNFWETPYKHRGGSGTNEFGGWLSNFVAHTKSSEGRFMVPRTWDAFDLMIDHGSTGTHVSTVPFVWEYHGREIPMVFAGGILNTHIFEGAICPSLGVAVLHQPK